MGLGAAKKRSKLSTDPNNTSWSKSTTNFGHRMLSKEGWKPGDYLGARDANHAEHFTAANASHIRVLLREDNLGIGAQIGGKGNAETFGLNLFSGVLGRLNGKSEGEVQQQTEKVRDAELRTWQERKYGWIRFVSGGLLVGDKMEEELRNGKKLPAVEAKAENADQGSSSSKKRKADDSADLEASAGSKKKSKGDSGKVQDSHSSKLKNSAKEGKKEKRRKVDSAAESSSSDESKQSGAIEEDDDKAQSGSAQKGKEKSRKKSKKMDADSSSTSQDDEKSRLKQEKRARKEERRRRREAKEEKRRIKAEKKAFKSKAPRDEAPSAKPPAAAPSFAGNRLSVRQRYIQQKRASAMDPQAMKEIFMVKASA